jgi:hypothetical protein
MAWRKIRKEDIKNGAVIRMTRICEDGAYGTATITSTRNMEDKTYPHVYVSRPMAYAQSCFDSKQPLLYAEVMEYGIDRLLGEGSDVEVFEGRDGIRTCVT